MAGRKHVVDLRPDRRILQTAPARSQGDRRRRSGHRHQGLRSDFDRPADARGNRHGRAGSEPPPASLRLEGAHARVQETARRPLYAALAPAGPAQRRAVALAQPSRAQGCANHAPRRHDEAHLAGDPRAHPLELRQLAADGSGDARPLFADRPRFRGQPGRQGPAEGRRGPQPDPGSGRNHHRKARAVESSSKCSACRNPRRRRRRRSTSNPCSAS